MRRQRMRFSANCIIMMQNPIRIILMRGPIRIRMTGSREADFLFPVMARFCPSDMNTSWRGSSVGFVTKGRGHNIGDPRQCRVRKQASVQHGGRTRVNEEHEAPRRSTAVSAARRRACIVGVCRAEHKTVRGSWGRAAQKRCAKCHSSLLRAASCSSFFLRGKNLLAC